MFNVNPAFYNSTLLDLLVHNGRWVKHSCKMWKLMQTRIPSERSAYEVDAALDFIDSMWTRQVYFKMHFKNSTACFRSNYSEGSQNGSVEMRRETAQFILEDPGTAQEKQVFKKKFQL